MKIIGLTPIQIFGAIIIGAVMSFALVAGTSTTIVTKEPTAITPVPTPAPVYVTETPTAEPTPIPIEAIDYSEMYEPDWSEFFFIGVIGAMWFFSMALCNNKAAATVISAVGVFVFYQIGWIQSASIAAVVIAGLLAWWALQSMIEGKWD